MNIRNHRSTQLALGATGSRAPLAAAGGTQLSGALLSLAVVMLAFFLTTTAWAGPGAIEDQAAVTTSDESDAPKSFLDIVTAGGVIGYLIMLLSIAAAALVIEHLLTIRTQVLAPAGLGEKVREQLLAGQLRQAEQQCKLQPSFLAYVLHAAISEIDGGYTAVEKAMEDATAEQSARLFRRIEYLSVIGNIAPMLGLLGTVIGMIVAFQKVASTQGAARAADLAEGIYLALVTTVEGLLVAIPALAAFAVFRNRVDQLVAETTYAAQHAVTPVKRLRRHRRAAPTTPPSAAEGHPQEGTA